MKIRLLPRSFSARLALVFWIMVFALTSIQFSVLYRLWDKANLEHLQRLNWPLANDIAKEYHEFFRTYSSEQELLRAVKRINSINPNVGIYIVSLEGEVYFAAESASLSPISVEPIEKFLTLDAEREVPLLGEHPDIFGKPQVFSAARINLGEQPAYLYVMLQGKKSMWFIDDLWEFYVLKAGMVSSIMLGFFAAILGSIVFYLVTRRFQAITGIVREISDGSSEKRVSVKGDDDIAVLGTEINRMVDTIAANIKSLEEKDNLRRELVSNVSHDVGNPLSSAQGFLENLLAKDLQVPAEEARAAVGGALSNVKLVSRLVKELFELSKLEAKEVTPEYEPFSLLDVVSEELLPKLEPLAKELGVHLTAEYPESLPLVSADIVMIHRAIYNLAENAVRYNRRGGTTTISLKDQGSQVEIEVSDTGSGIAEEELTQVFDRFFRAKSSGKTRGTGLGLAIVKQLIEAHGRTITVESSLGIGTTFRFSLPVVRSSDDDAPK